LRKAGAVQDEDNGGWTEPDDQMGLWEHQGHQLTVRWLQLALADLEPDAAVTIEQYDGQGGVRELRPMHIDLRGRPRAEAVVITVVE
jgi:hypothetical protein